MAILDVHFDRIDVKLDRIDELQDRIKRRAPAPAEAGLPT